MLQEDDFISEAELELVYAMQLYRDDRSLDQIEEWQDTDGVCYVKLWWIDGTHKTMVLMESFPLLDMGEMQ